MIVVSVWTNCSNRSALFQRKGVTASRYIFLILKTVGKAGAGLASLATIQLNNHPDEVNSKTVIFVYLFNPYHVASVLEHISPYYVVCT